MTLVPTQDSVLSITPARGHVEFELDGETWSEPLVGWGVVVGWRSLDDPVTRSPGLRDDHVELDSRVEPMLLVEDGQYVVSLRDYCRELGPTCKRKIVLE